MKKDQNIFTQLAKRYKTPKAVQNYLKTFHYNKNPRPTLYSAKTAIQKKEVHCMEGSFVAAAILEHHGFPPMVMSFESQDGLDHVIFVFKKNNKWGSIAKSRDTGLHGRAPIFKTLKELAYSYFDPYVDETGKITAYQIANLDDTKSNWRSSTRNVWKAEKYLLELKHIPMKIPHARYKNVFKKFKLKGPPKKGRGWW